MKIFIKILIIFSIVFFIGSCNDPIFYTVFQETPILKPFIDGSPTNFAVFDGSLYVASGKKIFKYNGKWSEFKKLNDRIGALAATDSFLYAYYLENDTDNGRIINLISGAILSLSNVQSIHADGDVLFISVRIDKSSSFSYEIHYKEETDTGFTIIILEKPEGKSDSMLVGVASNSSNYFLCTIYGIYSVDKTTFAATLISTPNDKDEFSGIISLKNDYVAVISMEGRIYEIDSANTVRTVINTEFSNSRSSTGALAVWYKEKTDTMPTLLLAGRKENYYTTSSGYTNGYVEITLDTVSGGISGSSFNEPGLNSPSSIDDNDRYVSSLGKKPVIHIIQTPADIDPNMRLLASTQQNGVWSYRDRGESEGWRWNAEQP